MNRDELVAKMIAVPQHADISVTVGIMLDVVLAEVLKYKDATEEEGKAVRLHNIGVSVDCILAELFEDRRAHYSAPREKTLVERVEAILNDRGYTWSRDDARDISKSIVALLEEGGAQ